MKARSVRRFSSVGRVFFVAAGVATLALISSGCSKRPLGMGGRAGGASALNSNPRTPDFALYAQNSMALGDRTAVTGGDVGVRLAGSGPFLTPGPFELFLSSGAWVDSARSLLANRLRMVNGAHAGDIQVNEFSDPSRTATYTHEYTFPASSMPALPPLAPVSPGTNPITVGQSSTVPSNSGNYGIVSIGNHGVWRLQGGVYQIASLEMDNDARIEALAPVQLRIAGRMSALDRVYIVPAAGVTLSAGDLRIEVSGRNGASGSLSDMPKAVAIANNPHIRAVILAPNGTLQSGARSVMTGAYVAKDISIGNDSPITYQSGVGPAGCLGCDDGNPCTIDECTAGTCTHLIMAAGTSCSDGDACNGQELCDGVGHCNPGSPVSCEPVNDGCHLPPKCDRVSGACLYDPIPNAPCDDHDLCTVDDRCSDGGICMATKPRKSCPGSKCIRPGECIAATGECPNDPIDGLSCNIFLDLNGVADIGDDQFVAVFGYHSTASGAFHPQTNTYWVDGVQQLMPQPAPPEYFVPGQHPGVFLATFAAGQTVSWIVDGEPVTATDNDPTHQIPTVPTTNGGLGVEIGGTTITVKPDLTPYSGAPDELDHGDDNDHKVGEEFKGKLKGQLTVNSMGAAVYTLPIAIPPGILGMAPNLNLVYNSQAGDGIAGRGWSLSGLSVINRCPKTYVQDGYAKVVEMGTNIGDDSTTADGLCLDGKRLLAREAQDGGTEYWTEIVDFSVIKYTGQGFRVVTKSGETRYYGTQSNSRVELPAEGPGSSPGGSPTMTPAIWALDKVEDTWGNYYEIRYNESANASTQGLVPTSITYTKHEGDATDPSPLHTVELKYESRSDVRNTRMRSSIVPLDVRLKSITSPRGQYTLNYVDDGDLTMPSRLHDITFCKADGTDCLPEPLTFGWSSGSYGWEALDLCEVPNPAHPLKGYCLPDSPRMGGQFVDLNGDGLVDFVVARSGLDAKRASYRNTGTEWKLEANWALPADLVKVTDDKVISKLTAFADLDGDGLPDVIDLYADSGPSVWLNRTNKTDGGWEFQSQLSGSNLTDMKKGLPRMAPNWDVPSSLPDWWDGFNSRTDQLVDIDGDGKVELVHVGTAAKPESGEFSCVNGPMAKRHYRMYVLSVGADKRWSLDTTSYWFTQTDIACQPYVQSMSDINRDGRADLQLEYSDDCGRSRECLAGLSKLNVGATAGDDGTGWKATTWEAPGPFTRDDTLFEMDRADIDGDGQYDAAASTKCKDLPEPGPNPIVFAAGLDWTKSDPNGYLATMSKFTNSVCAYPPIYSRREIEAGYFRLADLNADGLADLLVMHDWGARLHVNTGAGWVDLDGADDWGSLCAKPANEQHIVPKSPGAWKPWDEKDYRYADFVAYIDLDGNGVNDRVETGWTNNKSMRTARAWRNTFQPPVIDMFPNGMAADNVVAYNSITSPTARSEGIYNETSDSPASGTRFLMTPIRVVSSLTVDNGIGSTSTTTYQYFNLRTSATGRGPQGFEQVKIIEPPASGIVTTTTYSQSYPTTGSPSKVVKSKGGKTISETTTDYKVEEWGNVRFVHPDTVTETTHLLGKEDDSSEALATTETKYTYDDWGNPEDTVVTMTGAGGEQYSRDISNSYSGANEARFGKVTLSDVITSKLDGYGNVVGESRVHETEFVYEWPTGKLVKKRVEPGRGPKYELHTAYDYDRYGNLSVTTVCASSFSDCKPWAKGPAGDDPENPPFRTTYVSYDVLDFDPNPKGVTGRVKAPLAYSNGHFPVMTYNALDQIVEYYAYDPVLGVLVQSTGPNGVHTCRSYDALGWQYEEVARCGSTDPENPELTTTMQRYLSGEGGLTKLVTKTSPPNGATTWAYSDSLGRNLFTWAKHFGKDVRVSSTTYDELGRVQSTKKPARNDELSYATSYSYDWLGRLESSGEELGHINSNRGISVHVVTMAYHGARVETTELVGAESRTRWEEKNVLGKVVQSGDSSYDDPNGNVMRFDYDPDGNLTDTHDHAHDASKDHFIHTDYDILGRKLQMTDPDMGTWNYKYNGFGELIYQKDGRGREVKMAYDRLGRMVSKEDADGHVAKWVYDNAPGASLGKLAAMIGAPDTRLKGTCSAAGVDAENSATRSYSYDDWGNVSEVSECVDGETFSTTYHYDDKGRQKRVEYPQVRDSRLAVSYYYTSTGLLRYLMDDADGSVLWAAKAMNGLGQVTSEITRNGVETTYERNGSAGWLLGATSVAHADDDRVIQALGNQYNELGSLRIRSRSQPGQMAESFETFTYDRLERLATARVEIDSTGYDVTESFDYDEMGNISAKGGQTYSYTGCAPGAAGGPHAVCQVGGGTPFAYDSGGNLTYDGRRTITYSPLFNKPDRIVSAPGLSRGNDTGTVDFMYGADGNRVVQAVGDNESNELARTIYVGLGDTGKSLYERTTRGSQKEHVHFIYAGTAHGGNAFALRVTTEDVDSDANATTTRFNHFDHLGSVTAMSDGWGRVVSAGTSDPNATALGYDPWGARRSPDGQAAGLVPFNLQVGHREFTGHETIPYVGLVNMNGRVYDPQLGRFMSPDPNIQAPTDLQSYNRYSYVRNNPLKYTDPTGYFWGFTMPSGWTMTILTGAFVLGACATTGVGCAIAGTYLMMQSAAATILTGDGFDSVAMGLVMGTAISQVSGTIGALAGNAFGEWEQSALMGGLMNGLVSSSVSAAYTTLGTDRGFGWKDALAVLGQTAMIGAEQYVQSLGNPVSQASRARHQQQGGRYQGMSGDDGEMQLASAGGGQRAARGSSEWKYKISFLTEPDDSLLGDPLSEGEVKMVRRALERMEGTEAGKEMFAEMAQKPEGTIISKTPGGEPFSYGREIAIDPTNSLHLYLYTANPRGWDPLSLESSLSHEFGHRLGGQDSGIGGMDNTTRWEVPVEQQLGLYPRTQMGFAPWPGAPWQ